MSDRAAVRGRDDCGTSGPDGFAIYGKHREKGFEMAMKRTQPGLDGRHRDANGQIDRKHGNTLVGTLLETYGEGFAAGTRSDAKLSTVLERNGAESLSEYLKNK